jgi:tripartite ATP-independent transporter DctM subunit
MALGIPISLAMGMACVLVFLISGETLISLPQMIAMGISSYPLMAVPFFILAGNVMNYTGLTTRIFNFCKHLVGPLPGGLAQVNVLASMIFAGISGAAVADCAGLGTIQIKAMTDAGYRKPFSAAVTVASSSIGPIIPPSLILVIYAIESGTSVARLFLAGIIPGVMMGILLMAYIYYLVKTGKESCPTTPRPSLMVILKSFRDSLLAIISPVVILWALVSGVATPTEAGAIAAIYALVVGMIYGDFHLKDVPMILGASLRLTALIMFIIAMATVMTHILTIERTPQIISEALLRLTTNKYLLLLIINAFLLFLGSIIEGVPALIIMTPILLPIINAIGVDPVQFGIIICFNLVLGNITPPMAIGVVILVGITGCSFEELVRSSTRFLLPLIAALVFISFVPALSLYLPNLIMGF